MTYYYWLKAESPETKIIRSFSNLPIQSVCKYGMGHESLGYIVKFGYGLTCLYQSRVEYSFKFNIFVNNDFYGYTRTFETLDIFRKTQIGLRTCLIEDDLNTSNNAINVHYIGKLLASDDLTLVDNWASEGF